MVEFLLKKSNNMKIHIYYRHYDVKGNDGKNRPEWFDFENCYDNLLSTLPNLDSNTYRVNIIFDGDISSNWIQNYSFHKTHNIKAGNDTSSFFQTLKTIKEDSNIHKDDLIYVLENDYLHIQGWFDKILELFQTYQGLDYVSLYDHNDKYFLPQYSSLMSQIITTQNHHWRTTPSTCGSFIFTKETFDKDYDILSTMEGDHNKFLWLNQNRHRTVITPIPGLSTHCMQGLMSPTIKWEEI
jgi:hypothetical protein